MRKSHQSCLDVSSSLFKAQYRAALKRHGSLVGVVGEQHAGKGDDRFPQRDPVSAKVAANITSPAPRKRSSAEAPSTFAEMRMRTLENRRRLTEDAAPTPSDDSPADLRVPNSPNTGRGAAVPPRNGTRRSSLVPLVMVGLRDQAPGLPPVSKQKSKNKSTRFP